MFTLTEVQSQAIMARMALIVGAETLDRLFLGVEFANVDGDVLYVYAPTQVLAAELEERFALHLIIIATEILKHDIGILPRNRGRSVTRHYANDAHIMAQPRVKASCLRIGCSQVPRTLNCRCHCP